MAEDDDAQGGEEQADPGRGEGDGEERGRGDADPAVPEQAGPEPGPIERIRLVWDNPAYRFVLLFLPYLGVVAVAYPLFVRHYNPVVQWFILATARIEYWLFSIFSSQVRLDDKLVFFGSFAVKIIDECTGIYEMLIFAAAVLAFPTTWRKKAIGIVLGCPLIYLFNVLRIAVLIIVGRYWPSAFDFMHLYFWQATMIVMITSVWLLWIVKVVRDEEEPAPHRA